MEQSRITLSSSCGQRDAKKKRRLARRKKNEKKSSLLSFDKRDPHQRRRETDEKIPTHSGVRQQRNTKDTHSILFSQTERERERRRRRRDKTAAIIISMRRREKKKKKILISSRALSFLRLKVKSTTETTNEFFLFKSR